MINATKAIGVVASLLMLMPVAQADDRFSLRGSAGIAEPDESDFDDDVAFSVGGAWHFLPYLAAEIGYSDFGTFESKRDLVGAPIKVSGDSFEFGLLARLPLGDVGLFGQARLGGHRWDVRASTSVAGQIIEVGEEDTDLYYGLGVGYGFGARYGVVLGYDRYEVDEVDVDRISLGAEVRF